MNPILINKGGNFNMAARSMQDLHRDLQIELDPLFYPSSIAIIGASQNLLKPSGIPLALLTLFEYAGKVYPVNPKYDQLGGWKCYPTLADIPGPVDLAVSYTHLDVYKRQLLNCKD